MSNGRVLIPSMPPASFDAPVSDNFASSIARELRSDERLLWQGRPRGSIRLRAADFYLIPFSLFWCGFAFVGASGVIFGTKSASFGNLIFVLFAAVGLYSLIGRFFVDAMRRKNTAYALTGRRAIIAADFFGRNVQSINLQTLPEVSVTEKSDGSGSIQFGAAQPNSRNRTNPWSGAPSQPTFEMIEDVRRVSDLIDKARNGSK
jgi:hypothetical protein